MVGIHTQAGVAFASALVHLLTGCPLDMNIMMTGCISLSGKVGDVGGLDGKLQAALDRPVFRKFLLPAGNLEEAQEILAKKYPPGEHPAPLTLVPIKDLDDLLGHICLGREGRRDSAYKNLVKFPLSLLTVRLCRYQHFNYRLSGVRA